MERAEASTRAGLLVPGAIESSHLPLEDCFFPPVEEEVDVPCQAPSNLPAVACGPPSDRHPVVVDLAAVDAPIGQHAYPLVVELLALTLEPRPHRARHHIVPYQDRCRLLLGNGHAYLL